MKKSSKKLFLALLSSTILFSSCEKEKSATVQTTSGVYILNQGNWGKNNSQLSTFDGTSNGTIDVDYFYTQNQRALGDTGNDLKIYNDKMYCVVNGSNILEIMNASDAKSIKTISFEGKSPRNITFNGNKAYVCSIKDNSVCEIDLSTYMITATTTVGNQPENLCVSNNKLYVSNSGYGSGNTVSIIDLATLKVTQTITVGKNPGAILADENGNVFVLLQGESNTDGSYKKGTRLLKKINSNGEVSTIMEGYEFTNFTIYNESVYAYTTTDQLKVLGIANNTITKENFITDGTLFKKFYSISVNPLDGKVYICDANNYTNTGWLYCFDTAGKLEYKKDVGVNPSKVVFLIK